MGMVVPGLVRVRNGAPSIEGLDISINGTLWMDLGLVKKGGSATMQLLSQWPMLEVWSQESLVLSDVVFHDSTVGMELNLGIHNEVAGGTVAFTNRFQVMTVLLYDYRSIELVNPKGLNITRLPSNKTTTDTGLPYDSKLIMEEYENVVLVVAEVDGPFTTKGPHAFDLTITGARTNGIRVLEYTFHPFYSGTQRPSFDASLILDGAQVHDGRDLIKIDIEPAFTSAFDRFHSDLRISNSTFFGVRGSYCARLNPRNRRSWSSRTAPSRMAIKPRWAC